MKPLEKRIFYDINYVMSLALFVFSSPSKFRSLRLVRALGRRIFEDLRTLFLVNTKQTKPPILILLFCSL
jgi:hypothetical protein